MSCRWHHRDITRRHRDDERWSTEHAIVQTPRHTGNDGRHRHAGGAPLRARCGYTLMMLLRAPRRWRRKRWRVDTRCASVRALALLMFTPRHVFRRDILLLRPYAMLIYCLTAISLRCHYAFAIFLPPLFHYAASADYAAMLLLLISSLITPHIDTPLSLIAYAMFHCCLFL